MPNHVEIHFRSQKDCNVALRLPATYPVLPLPLNAMYAAPYISTSCIVVYLRHCLRVSIWHYGLSISSGICHAFRIRYGKTERRRFFFIETHLCSPPAARILSFLMLISFFFLRLVFIFHHNFVVVAAAGFRGAMLCIVLWCSLRIFEPIIKFYALPSIHSPRTLHVYPDIALRSKFLLRFG